MDGRIFGEVLVTLFMIMDPPGSVPILLGGVIVCFAVAGRQALEYLGIAIRPAACRSSAPPGTRAGPGPI